MSLDRAPWDTPTPPGTRTPSPVPNQMADLEKFMNMAEGFMDRVLPRMQKFLDSARAAKEGRSMSQVQAVDGVRDGGYEPLPPQQQVSHTASNIQPETIYGIIFDMLNLVPDGMTCADMRTWVRENKVAIIAGIGSKLDASNNPG